jgi:hypothetical protein
MRTPKFLQTRVERLERALDVRGIVAILSDHSQRVYERAHAAKALADLAGRLGDHRDEAVMILLQAADEPSEVRKWALLALAVARAVAGSVKSASLTVVLKAVASMTSVEPAELIVVLSGAPVDPGDRRERKSPSPCGTRALAEKGST